MGKIWVTRSELNAMIKEALGDVDWGSMVPDKDEEPTARASERPSPQPSAGGKGSKDLPPFVAPKTKLPAFGADPRAKDRVLGTSKPSIPAPSPPAPTLDKPRPAAKQPSVIPGGDVGRSRWVGRKDQPDPTAREPYTKRDLAQGVDVDQQPQRPKQGLMDRIKGMFGGKERSGFEDAPNHWSAQQKEKFHRDRAISMRDRTKQYSKMFSDARQSGDGKKSAYAKKMHGFYSRAAAEHERVLKGVK